MIRCLSEEVQLDERYVAAKLRDTLSGLAYVDEAALAAANGGQGKKEGAGEGTAAGGRRSGGGGHRERGRHTASRRQGQGQEGQEVRRHVERERRGQDTREARGGNLW